MTEKFKRSRILCMLNPVQKCLPFFLLIALAFTSACETAEPEQPRAVKDILEIAKSTGFELLPVSATEQSFLQFLFPGEQTALRSAVLLRDDERVAALYFLHSPNAKNFSFTLKERAFDLFSSQMTNLINERIERAGYASFDVFAFTDPVLGEDRFLFVLLGNVLYEFHVKAEMETVVQGLILEVARESNM